MKQNKRFNSPGLILASASPRRRQLMREHGYKFQIRPSRVSEKVSQSLPPSELVRHLALKKAQAISKHYPKDTILGADTVVFIEGKIIGKPRNDKDACKILKQLSGKWQRVYTGVALAWEGGRKCIAGHAVSYVKFRRLTEKDIQQAAKKHQDKAGAYSVQEKSDPFVERIRGDFDNVVGLPMRLVKKLLRRSRRVH